MLTNNLETEYVDTSVYKQKWKYIFDKNLNFGSLDNQAGVY